MPAIFTRNAFSRNVILVSLGLGSLVFFAFSHPILGGSLLLLLVPLFLVTRPTVDTYIKQGNTHYALGHYQQAIAAYDLALQRHPQSALAYCNRGAAYAASGDINLAMESYNQALQLEPNFAQAYAERGILRSAVADHTGAIADCDHALQLNPQYVRAYYGRSAARAYQGDLAGAITDLLQQIQLQPTAAAYYNVGSLSYFLADYATAIAHLTEAIQLEPDFVSAYYSRGNAYYDMGDQEKAWGDFKQAMQLEANGKREQYPDDEHGLYARALAKYRLALRESVFAAIYLRDCLASLERAAQTCRKHQNTPLLQKVVTILQEIQQRRAAS